MFGMAFISGLTSTARQNTAFAENRSLEDRSGCVFRLVVTSAESAGVSRVHSREAIGQADFLKALLQQWLRLIQVAAWVEIFVVVRHLLPV